MSEEQDASSVTDSQQLQSQASVETPHTNLDALRARIARMSNSQHVVVHSNSDVITAFVNLATLLSEITASGQTIDYSPDDVEKISKAFSNIQTYATIIFECEDDEEYNDEVESVIPAKPKKKKFVKKASVHPKKPVEIAFEEEDEEETKEEVENQLKTPEKIKPSEPIPSPDSASSTSSTSSKAKKKPKKSEDDWTIEIRKEIKRCASLTEKNEDGTLMSPEQQMVNIRIAIQKMLQNEVGINPAESMKQKECESEIDAILEMQSKMKEMGLLYRYRCGQLWFFFIYSAEKQMEEEGLWYAVFNGKRYDTPTSYLAAKYQDDRTDIVQHKKFYKLVIQFFPLLKTNKGWRWIRDALTYKKLETQIEIWNKNGGSFDE